VVQQQRRVRVGAGPSSASAGLDCAATAEEND
jgi:hypothetical protein